MWVQTSEGFVNLDKAFEISYSISNKIMNVWMGFAVPDDNDTERLASGYDTARLFKYNVEPHEWNRIATALLS